MLDRARVKAFLKFEPDDTAPDDDIDGLLAAAKGMVEVATGHLLAPATVVEQVGPRRFAGTGIRLFKAPVTAVASVTYPDGAWDNPVAVDGFQLVEGANASLLPAWGAAWPSLGLGESLTVTYTAGYPEDEIPADLEQAVVSLTAHLFHHRDDMADMPPFVEKMLAPYRPLGIA